jgi:cytochrome c-type biogenesis protein CcmH
MVSKLEARLTASPRDADGWIMLIRSRKTLGQPDQAKAALNKALAVFADDKASRERIAAASRELGVQ